MDTDALFAFVGDVDIKTISSAVLESYINSIAKSYSINSLCHKISVIKALFNYLYADNLIEVNPSVSLVFPKKPLQLPNFLTIDQMKLLLDYYKNKTSPEDIRNYTILELLYSTGCRVSELCNLNISDFYKEEDYNVIKIKGKGNKERLVFLNKSALTAYNNYLILSRPFMMEKAKVAPDYDCLFFNKRGLRLSRQLVWEVIKNLSNIFTPPIKLYPHTIRHSFATHLLLGGADILSVQELLGHSSINTTQLYTHISISHLQSVFNSSHPRL